MPADAIAAAGVMVAEAPLPRGELTAVGERRRRRVRKVASYVLLTAASVVVLFPIYISIVNSLEPATSLAHQPPPFFPLHPVWHTYSSAWGPGNLSIYLRNSVIQTGIIVAGQLVTSVLAGYAFAFLNFPLKRVLFLVFLSTLMIPFEVTFITNLTTITRLHWFNTFQGLTVPFLATGFGTFLLRQAFLQIPRDLQEAATLDGYGHWRFMTRVAVPLARPALAALGVFSFLGAWNQYLWPLVATGQNNHVVTVQIGLKLLAGNLIAANVNEVFAGAVIALAPLAILLIVFQKQLVRSLTAGAVK
ncbi:MAG TPA: carbohydrate ABC transporter permease [Acidimicrobiales bacterium]|nr:carbohydrate ABC transporter permease [Acidimicrobiales bacterium]